MRLVFVGERMNIKMIENWFKEDMINKSKNSICELIRYGILRCYDINGNEIMMKRIKESMDVSKYNNVELNKEFKNQLIVYNMMNIIFYE